MIPDEAVEAAAKAAANADLHAGLREWEKLSKRDQCWWQTVTRAALEAAAPHMLAELEKRRKYAALDAISELGSDNPNENPYRSQA